MTYDATVLPLRDEGKHKVLVRAQAVDEIGLGRTAEGIRQDGAYRATSSASARGAR